MLAVSVIIVNYNAGPALARAVLSLRDAVAEVIVVDNASSDGSTALPGILMGGSVHLIHNDTNRGFAAACNQGIAAANQPMLLFLNPDCVMSADALARLIDSLTRHPSAGMAGGLLQNPDGSEQRGGRRLAPNPQRALRRALWLDRIAGLRTPDFNLENTPLPDAPVFVEAISGACMLVRREALQVVGPWDEGFFLHCEDLDWCIRFRQSGFNILFDPHAAVMHEKGTCSRSRPVFVEWHKHRGMLRYFRKHLAQGPKALLIPMIGFLLLTRFCLLALAINARASRGSRQ